MQYRAALAVAALLPLASTFQITITSNCDFPIYGWNVVDNYGSDEPTFTLQQGSQSWNSPFQTKEGGGGPSIKLQKENSLFVNALQTQVEYDMAGSTLFYDLSDVNGSPFSGSEIIMQTTNPSCPVVNCPASEAVCSQAYQHPDDLRTLACDGGADIEVLLCGAGGSSGSGSSSSGSSSAAAPAAKPTTLSTKAAVAPATTAPPPQPTQQGSNFLEENPDGDVEVVVATTIVKVTHTVHAPAGATGPADKRDAEADAAHLHAHLHRGHSRVMGRHAH